MGNESTTGALKTIDVTGHSRGPKSTHVETAQAEFVVGKEVKSIEYLLGSLASCLNDIGHMVAEEHGITIRDLDIHVEGDIDPAGHHLEGDVDHETYLATKPPARFQAIRAQVTVDADADADTLQAWMTEVTERCPVVDTIRNGSTLEISVNRA